MKSLYAMWCWSLVFVLHNRTGKHGYIQIDGGSVQRGQSQGNSIMVNTKGNIYLGVYHIVFFPLPVQLDQTWECLLLACRWRSRHEVIDWWEVLVRRHRLREEPLADKRSTGRAAGATHRPSGPRRGGHKRGALLNIDAVLKHYTRDCRKQSLIHTTNTHTHTGNISDAYRTMFFTHT